MSEVDKENTYSPTRINKRKSYSILSPVNQRAFDINTNNNDRIISESTGLVKFSLSPSKCEEPENTTTIPKKLRGKSGLPVYVPINETVIEQNESSQDLMIQFASKQRQLIELEKQVESTKFELAEISSNIAKDIEQPKQETNTGSFNNFNNLNNLKKKASNIFQINQGISPNREDGALKSSGIKMKGPSAFPPLSPAKSINNFTNYFTKVQDHISQTQLNTPALKNFVNDVKNKIEVNENDKFKTFLAAQQNEFDEFTTKTSKFVNGLFNNLSSKTDMDKEDMANSSFNFEAIEDANKNDILNSNVSLSEDDTTFGDERDIVDIDDYNSSFEEEL